MGKSSRRIPPANHLNRPQYVWDSGWTSAFCASQRPELEALLGIRF